MRNALTTAIVAAACLAGTRPAFALDVMPASINFGGTQIGQPIAKTITVANNGGAKVSVQTLTITMGQSAYTLSNVPNLPVALNVGTSFTFTITFSPQMNGLTMGNAALTSNDPNTPMIMIALSGFAGPPAISLDAGSIAFGSVNLGATSTPSPVSVSNSGFSDLKLTDIQISGPNAADFILDKKMAVGTIAAMQATPFAVSFKPQALGMRTATVTVVSSAGNKTVSLQGSGTSAMMKVLPGMLAFGNTQVGMASIMQALTVSNAGTGILQVMSLTLTGPGAAGYTVDGPGGGVKPFTVAPNGMQMVQVACAPKAVGSGNATLTIVSDVSMAAIPLTCTGVAPVIAVAPTSLDFGSVAVGDNAMPKTVTVTNNGTIELNVMSVTVTGNALNDYSTDLQMLGPVAPKASVTLKVSFMPSASGKRDAQVELMSDDPTTPSVRVKLTGNGTQPAYTVTPDPMTMATIDFGMIPTDMTGTKKLSFDSNGDGPVVITSFMFSGMGGAFSADAMVPLTIPPGMTQDVNLLFKPTMSGMFQAMVTINVQNLMPTEYMLTGVGVAPSIMVSPMALDFGPVAVGSSSGARPVIISNNGPTPIQLGAITSNDPTFTIDMPSDTKIGMGGMATFNVTFSPTSAVLKSGAIYIAVVGQAKPLGTIQVTGLGVTPAMHPGCTVANGAAAGGRGSAAMALAGLLALLLRRSHRRRR